MRARRARNEEHVFAELVELHRRGIPISLRGLIAAGHGPLVADIRFLGGIAHARRRAGLPRPVGERRRLGQEAVLEEIRRRARQGEPVTWSRIPRALRRAGVQGFGSWRAAVTAAGLDYRAIRARARDPR